jgi:hypothetical protein
MKLTVQITIIIALIIALVTIIFLPVEKELPDIQFIHLPDGVYGDMTFGTDTIISIGNTKFGRLKFINQSAAYDYARCRIRAGTTNVQFVSFEYQQGKN